MIRQLKIFRGNTLLGYVGLDDGLGHCRPFEPAEGYSEIEALFLREHELSMQLEDSDPEEESKMIEILDSLMEEILGPGVTIQSMDGTQSFGCLQLTIGDGRVCWR
ncbi:MAG: hypothetical protein U0905_13885 [Pirellulales bacterium]